MGEGSDASARLIVSCVCVGMLVAMSRGMAITRLAGAILWMSLLAAQACGGDCPPLQYDDVFPLDLKFDAGVSSDASPSGRPLAPLN